MTKRKCINCGRVEPTYISSPYCEDRDKVYCDWRNPPVKRTPETMRSLDPITYRGSICDFATDIAYELTPIQAKELIAELQQFLIVNKSKFR